MNESVELWFSFWQLWNFGVFAERLPLQFLEMANALDPETIEVLDGMSIYHKTLQAKQ